MEKKHFETLNVCSFFLLVLFLITKKPVFLYISFGLIGVSIFIKPLGRLIAASWLKFSYLIGTVNSRVLLTLFFFLFLTPLALIRRLSRQNLLQLKKGSDDSYWKRVEGDFHKDSLEKTW